MTPEELLKEVSEETPINLRFVGKITTDQRVTLNYLGDTSQTFTVMPSYRQPAEYARTKEGLSELVHAAIGPYIASLHDPYKVVCVLCLDPVGHMAWVGAALDHTVGGAAQEGGPLLN